MITADLRSFLMALATIPASRVAEHVRPKLIDAAEVENESIRRSAR